jgi:arsenate reductase
MSGEPALTVLFVCVENSCRSLMAEAIFNARAPSGWRAISAGTIPATAVNLRTRPMLREIGVELPHHAPQPLTEEAMVRADVRITMGCLDDQSCPARLHALGVSDWGLPDPSTLDDAGFRAVRETIRQRVDTLLRELELREPPHEPSTSSPGSAP